MSNKLSYVILAAFLGGCTWFGGGVKEPPNAKEVVKLDLQVLPPLDLNKYQEMKFLLAELEKQDMACIDLSQFQNFDEMLAVLQNRIAQQGLMLQKYREYYEKQP